MASAARPFSQTKKSTRPWPAERLQYFAQGIGERPVSSTITLYSIYLPLTEHPWAQFQPQLWRLILPLSSTERMDTVKHEIVKRHDYTLVSYQTAKPLLIAPAIATGCILLGRRSRRRAAFYPSDCRQILQYDKPPNLQFRHRGRKCWCGGALHEYRLSLASRHFPPAFV